MRKGNITTNNYVTRDNFGICANANEGPGPANRSLAYLARRASGVKSRCPAVVPLPHYFLVRAFDVMHRCIDLLMLLSMAALWSATAMAIEEPAHTVIEREAPFEVRDYQSYVVAETFVDGSFNTVGNEGFERLFRYISGENRAAEKITMTAPVEQEAASAKIAMAAPVEQQRAGSRWRVAFVLPSSYTLANAPRPTDDRVVLAEAPPRRMAVVRYRGTWSEARYGKELAMLRKFIGERGLTALGEPVFARFDPPFMPWFLRRNEIQIPVQGPAAR